MARWINWNKINKGFGYILDTINFQYNIDGKIEYMNISIHIYIYLYQSAECPLYLALYWRCYNYTAHSIWFLQSIRKWYIEEYLLPDIPYASSKWMDVNPWSWTPQFDCRDTYDCCWIGLIFINFYFENTEYV